MMNNELSNFANDLISRSNKLRLLHQSIKNTEYDIKNLKSTLQKLENDKSRKDKSKHKEQIKYQIRQAEINLAFYLHDWALVPDSLKKFYHLN